jgi:dCMP deaminase
MKVDLIDWDTYFMEFAKTATLKCKDSTKVGACLVSPEGTVILTAFNGPPKGVVDYDHRFERPAKYLFASHAETNLVAFAARSGIKTHHCRVYCTHFACAACARTMIQAGIAEVVHGPGTFQALEEERDAVESMYKEAGVRFREYQEIGF